MIDRELVDYMLTSGCIAAIQASKNIMEIYQKGDFDVNLKSDNKIITEADTESHNTIKRYLARTRTPMLSEEGRNMLYEERYRWDMYWLVDPLDGTREFVKHNDEFVVAIALMDKAKPIIGIIAVPASGKLYFSDPDRGAFCIDQMYSMLGEELAITELYRQARKLTPEIDKESKNLKIIHTRSHMNSKTEEIIERQKEMYDSVECTECGSALKFCRIAEGEFDAFFRMTDMLDWDVAAGEALVKAAGAQISHFNKDEQIIYNKESLYIAPHYVSFKPLIIPQLSVSC